MDNVRIKKLINRTSFRKVISRVFTLKNKIQRECRLLEIKSDESLKVCGSPECPKLVASLTSYGNRLSTVHISIRSLLMQTCPPDIVVLWIGDESNEIQLPDELLNLQKYGLRIVRDCENLKGHKKYYEAFRQYPESLVLTFDDDLIYARDTVESLIKWHDVYPDAVIARRVHRIKVGSYGVMPYSDWDIQWGESTPVPRNSLVATTGAGTLYPSSVTRKLLYPSSAIKEIALNADDLWLKGAEVANSIPVVFAPNRRPMPFQINGTQDEALCYRNVLEGENDIMMAKIMSYFNLSSQSFLDSRGKMGTE